MDLPQPALDLARRQRGLLTRRQLADCGVSAAVVRWRLGRTWRLVLPGVVLLDWAMPSDLQRCIAALLYAGPQSWLSGPSAGALHRVVAPTPRSRVHLLVAAPGRPRDVGWLSIRRTHLVDERLVTDGVLRYSCLPRAVVDSAAAMAPDEARALIIETVQRRLVRLDDVSHWIEARRPNGRAVLRRALAEAAAGAWSLPEADLARLMSRSSVLPEPWLNPELRDVDGSRLTTPDLWLDDVAMAVMVHSREYHGGVIDWESTVERDADLSACRVVVVGVTPGAIARDPDRVLRRIETAYLTALRSGRRAQVTATPRVVSIGRLLGAGTAVRPEGVVDPPATARPTMSRVTSRVMSREVS